jgi:hypothetical protein
MSTYFRAIVVWIQEEGRILKERKSKSGYMLGRQGD